MGSPGVGEEAFAVGQVRFRHSRLPLDSFTVILAVRRGSGAWMRWRDWGRLRLGKASAG